MRRLAAAAFSLLALEGTAQVLAVRLDVVEGRPALQVLTFGVPEGVSVGREGEELVVSLGADAPPLQTPLALPPIQSVGIVRAAGRVTIRLRVPAEVPFEVRRDAGLLTVLFDETAAPALTPEESDVSLLYRQLFPAPPPPPLVADQELDPEQDGIRFGPFQVRPGISLSYATAESTIESPTPVRDEYFVVQPRIGLETTLWDGRFTAGYEPTLRGYSSFEQTNQNSHMVYAALQLELGPSLHFRVNDRHMWGILETDEVDPGREYFFQLAGFERNILDAGLRLKGGSRFDIDVSGFYNDVRFDEPTSFFDYDRWAAKLGLGYELSPRIRSELAYVYDEVPEPADRPEAFSQGHTVRLSFEGELVPLMDAEIFGGYQWRDTPNAGEGGTRFESWVAGASLRKELSPGSWVSLLGERSTYPSSFESNGIYLSNALQATYSLPLPWVLSLSLGGGYRLNEYAVVSPEIGEPREDRLWGWSVGLGRSLKRWVYLRVDYNWQKRDSNLNGFDTQTGGFLFQLGLRFHEGS